MTKPTTQDSDVLLSIPGNWNIQYNYAAGKTASRFFVSLRDHQKIEATVCPSCARAMVPPRGFCDRCFVPCEEWREVGPEGHVVSFTISYIPSRGFLPPFMIAMIRLDGADTNIIHLVEGCDMSAPEALLAQVKAGLRVRAEYKPDAERHGNILDIASFRAVA